MIARPIRLLFFTREDFPTHRVDIEVLFGRELAGRGHAIDLVTQSVSEDTAAGPQNWHGRTAFVGPTARGHGFVGRLLKHCLSMWHDLGSLRMAQPERYDAIQVRDKFLIATVGVIVAHLRGLKFFFWLSFPMPEADLHHARSGNARFPAINWVRGVLSGWLLYRWIIPRSDHVFVQSECMKDEVCARGADPQKVTAVPMGVCLEDVIAAESPASSAANGEIKLGYLGTLDANRHLGVLVDMLGLLRQSGLPARLVLVGDAHAQHDRELLERHAAALGLTEYLEITGFLPHLAALKRICAMDICLSPIYPSPIFRVASPTKLVEYLALGLPVVANMHPEQRLILRQSRAGLCVPWSARHFARAVRWLMLRKGTQLDRMRENGRRWVKEHRTYSRIADEVEQKYLALLQARGDSATEQGQ
jgi:glycosyltransferase involved in cell wall biosynthesis